MAVNLVELKENDLLRSRYKIIKLIGTGGMSKVYLASDTSNPNLKWAVKVTNSTHPLFKRIIHEATLLSELDHPSIPKIADFFTSANGEYFYLVQEYLEGETLLALSKSGHLSFENIVEYAIKICDCLNYLHNLTPFPIIYRDLKPSNIIVNKDHDIKLIDYGIARKFREDRFHDTVQIGTVGFAAPEQFEKQQTDQRTDIFSLGAMLYYLVTKGKYVYISQKPITHYREDLPDEFVKLVEEMVQIEPVDRPLSIQTVKRKLIEIRGDWKDDQQKNQEALNERKHTEGYVPTKRHKGWAKLLLLYSVIGFIVLLLSVGFFLL